MQALDQPLKKKKEERTIASKPIVEIKCNTKNTHLNHIKAGKKDKRKQKHLVNWKNTVNWECFT